MSNEPPVTEFILYKIEHLVNSVNKYIDRWHDRPISGKASRCFGDELIVQVYDLRDLLVEKKYQPGCIDNIDTQPEIIFPTYSSLANDLHILGMSIHNLRRLDAGLEPLVDEYEDVPDRDTIVRNIQDTIGSLELYVYLCTGDKPVSKLSTKQLSTDQSLSNKVQNRPVNEYDPDVGYPLWEAEEGWTPLLTLKEAARMFLMNDVRTFKRAIEKGIIHGKKIHARGWVFDMLELQRTNYNQWEIFENSVDSQKNND